MPTSLFQSASAPAVSTVDEAEVPAPGPNAAEVAVVQWDPDSRLVVVGLANDVQAVYKIEDMPTDGSGFTILLEDSKLGPKIELHVTPRTPMPKFSSPEEADAWLEANA